jgi:hypothetical protein
MPIQTSYGFFHDKGIQGMPYDLSPSFDATADATVAIEFGTGLVVDASRTNADGRIPVKLPDAAGNVLAGIAVYDRAQQVTAGTPAGLGDLTTTEGTLYPASEPIRLRKRGRLYVYCEQAVNPADPVFLRFAANGALVPGNFRKDADTSRAFQINNAAWVKSTTGAGLAVIEINLP